MSIVNFDRDLSWLKPNSHIVNVGMSTEAVWSLNPNVTSDAMVYGREAYIDYFKTANLVFSSVGLSRFIGVHLTGPDITGGSPYRIKGYCHDLSNTALVAFIYAIGPAIPTTSPAGDICEASKPLYTNKGYIEINETVYIPSFEETYPGLGYSARPLTICIMVHSISTLSFQFSCRLSVQRLSVKPPAYITANR